MRQVELGMRYLVAKWRYQRRGFRAKISAGHFVFEERDRTRPVAGPFATRSEALREAERLKNAVPFIAPIADTTGPAYVLYGEGSSTMSEKTKETERTERTTETEKDTDPSDAVANEDDNPTRGGDRAAEGSNDTEDE